MKPITAKWLSKNGAPNYLRAWVKGYRGEVTWKVAYRAMEYLDKSRDWLRDHKHLLEEPEYCQCGKDAQPIGVGEGEQLGCLYCGKRYKESEENMSEPKPGVIIRVLGERKRGGDIHLYPADQETLDMQPGHTYRITAEEVPQKVQRVVGILMPNGDIQCPDPTCGWIARPDVIDGHRIECPNLDIPYSQTSVPFADVVNWWNKEPVMTTGHIPTFHKLGVREEEV